VYSEQYLIPSAIAGVRVSGGSGIVKIAASLVEMSFNIEHKLQDESKLDVYCFIRSACSDCMIDSLRRDARQSLYCLSILDGLLLTESEG
jgi:hypothetical protein